eukprot:TRINITY_DN5189_c0_g1_i2.p1 TRINITY_DN5189_c0_g1~~TRINITY_DN5189_c0_g1_i2.p1  ORF type:complete len:512 (+),score=96.39 TRINITY_DN5189_c0_g1_i2:2904-4439(+)
MLCTSSTRCSGMPNSQKRRLDFPAPPRTKRPRSESETSSDEPEGLPAILNLPDDLIRLIIGFFSFPSLRNLLLTCKTFLRCALTTVEPHSLSFNLETIPIPSLLEAVQRYQPKEIKLLKGDPACQIKALEILQSSPVNNLTHSLITAPESSYFSYLGALPLQKLSLFFHFVESDKIIDAINGLIFVLSRLPQLRKLSLAISDNRGVTATQFFEILDASPKLEELSVPFHDITDVPESPLRHSLRSLRISTSGCAQIASFLTSVPNVSTLDCTRYQTDYNKLVKDLKELHCSALLGSSEKLFRECPQLKSLHVRGYFERIEDHFPLEVAKNLETLVLNINFKLTKTYFKSFLTSGENLKTLVLCPGTMDNLSLTDDILVYIALGCPNLVELKLPHWSRLTDKSFKLLSTRCPKLELVYFQSMPLLTLAAFEALSTLKNLRDLFFSNHVKGATKILTSNCAVLRKVYILLLEGEESYRQQADELKIEAAGTISPFVTLQLLLPEKRKVSNFTI